MGWFFIIVFGVLWGLWCKSIAERKNRDGTAGFIFGFFFGLIAVLVYSFLSDDATSDPFERVRKQCYRSVVKGTPVKLKGYKQKK